MSSINYFEIVRDIMVSKITNSSRKSDLTQEEIYRRIYEAIINNSQQWHSGKQPQIPYSDPYCRLAYLYHVVPANANLVEYVFRQDVELAQYMVEVESRQNCVKICVFGGGPGTEVLGISKSIDRIPIRDDSRPVHTLKFLLLDKVNEWFETWLALQEQIENRCNRVSIQGNCWPVDITDTSKFAHIGDVFGQDVYIFSWILSEIFDEHDLNALTNFIGIMAENAPYDSKFVFIDRNEPWLRQRVQSIAADIELELSAFTPTRSNMDTDEQLHAVSDITDRLSGRKPKLKWDAFWVIGTKIIPF